MSKLDEVFKFKIGDRIKLIAHGEGYDADGNRHMPQALNVVERLAQECPGGIQLHYLCRVVSMDMAYKIMRLNFSSPVFQINEIEVEAYPAPELSKTRPVPPPKEEAPE
jgi:hypothetical protein